MESRKRPHADDAEPSRPKKRAVSDDRASPSHPNGNSSHGDEPKDSDGVELFRKEALYRRMKHYSREAEKSQARVAELERRRSQCEAGLAALEACWVQLIGTIRSLVKPEDLPSVQKESEGLRDLTAHVSSEAEPEYVDALREKMQATSDIVRAFVNLSAQTHSGPSDEQMVRRCQEAEAESSVLRSELSLVRTKLRDAESQKEKFREELVAAEKRADRLQSKSLNPNASKVEDQPGEGSAVESTPLTGPRGANGAPALDSEGWAELANYRETKIEELTLENNDLRDQLHHVTLQLRTLPDEAIRNSGAYKLLLTRTSRYDFEKKEALMMLDKTRTQLEELQTTRFQFEDSVTTNSDTEIQDLKNMLSKRDTELTRIRDLRDQYHTELVERRAADANKTSALSEFQALAETRAERIAVLESENQRLKTRLAANSGDEDLVAFLWSNTSDGPSYVDNLKRRLLEAEARVVDLEKTVGALEGGRADVAKIAQSEAELRRQVEQVQKQLDKYQTVYGNASSLPVDAVQLSEQLQRKQAEIDVLKVQEKQRDQAESSIYSELDKLSTAWEALDKQVKSKVYDLSALEDRVAKATVERAKAENKFYAAVRDKDAIEFERKNLVRNLDKAGKALDKLTQSEKHLEGRVRELDREIAFFRRAILQEKDRTTASGFEIQEWQMRFYSERKSAEEIRSAFNEHVIAYDKKRAELRKLEESLIKAKKDAEKQATKLKSLSSSSGSNAKEAELQSEIDKCMSLLKCSTCKMNMRNTVITKCMHSFCKSCVEARIATRQRKCPACNLPFSQGEVQQLYFQ
ncbi:BRE1-domain-containing protein [Trametes meyenii]|nr:BRE1-domain-containing protein [Trametes meyenii]